MKLHKFYFGLLSCSIGSTPQTPASHRHLTAKRRRVEEESPSIDALLKSHEKTRECLMQGKRARTKEQHFFDHCAERIMEFPPKIRSTLQMQIMQLFYNAEHVDEGLSVPLVPLRAQRPMPVNGFHHLNYTPSLTSSDESRPATPIRPQPQAAMPVDDFRLYDTLSLPPSDDSRPVTPVHPQTPMPAPHATPAFLPSSTSNNLLMQAMAQSKIVPYE